MKFLRNLLDQAHPHVSKGGKYEKLYVLFEMADTFLFTPGEVTKGNTHVRDGLDLKRLMFSVIIALLGCIGMAVYNTGYQANLALSQMGITEIEGWRGAILSAIGVGFDPTSCFDNVMHGLVWFLPVFLIVQLAGGFWEATFAMVRGHEINEGFLVTGMLFPLILPPTIPLWQAALGVSFGVVIGKEVFGGTGKNFLNPALTGRAFLFFAYPAAISGDQVWTAVDGFSGATALSIAQSGGLELLTQTVLWKDAFIGFIPGAMGETSAIAALIGAVVLVVMGIGSWRVMASLMLGAFMMSTVFNEIGSATNPMFSIPFSWHLVMGGFAFGMAFMATDPVTSAMTRIGQWYFGILIGIMVILIRVVNPAFPEGMMLAILFGNIFAPVIDHYVLAANIKRRAIRNEK